MIKNKRRRSVFSMLLMAGALMLPEIVWSQLWIGTTGIIQNGTVTGYVWVGDISDPCQYTEYWYLGPEYVYPNAPVNGQFVEVLLLPDENGLEFTNPREFFLHAQGMLPGGKRVVAAVFEMEQCGPQPTG